jgi:glycosyltransferase involved in cell wall biosynthesis
MRVLHVVTTMNRGGVEVWLMHMLRNMDRSQMAIDFVVQSDLPALFDGEIEKLGSRIIRCPRASAPHRFARAYLRALREHGPYDVVHTHLHHFSGVVALLSRLAGVPVVVAHSHNDTYGDRTKLPWRLRSYLAATEWMLRTFSDYGIGCSERAGVDLFQRAWKDRQRHGVLYCGLQFATGKPSSRSPAPLPPDFAGRKVIVHVGRFARQKNHDFLVDVVAELARRRDDFRVLLVGNGDLQPAIAGKIARLQLGDKMVLAGDRGDVDRILEASDAFLFPSLHEGLGLALIEAQAAGLRCLISDVVPAEAIVNRDDVRVLPLAAGAASWAEALDEMLSRPAADRARALATLQASPFSVSTSIRDLSALYRRLLGDRAPKRAR